LSSEDDENEIAQFTLTLSLYNLGKCV